MAIITSAVSILFGSWLLDKIKDKGFDKITTLLEKSDSINDKFNNAVSKVSQKLQEKYPIVLGGKMDYFFKNEQVYKELTKLIFVNSVVDIDSISKSFDTDTLPKNFLLEFITELKKELLKDRELESIISDKELFVLIYGITNDVNQIANNSNLSLKEVTEIKELLQQRIGEKFNYNNFYKIYKENALNNFSQVNFIGLGIGASISKKINRKDLQDIFVKPIFKFMYSEELYFPELLTEDDDFMNEIIENSLDHENLYPDETEMLPIDFDDFEDDFEGIENLISYDELFNNYDKIIILGSPGSGKSMLIKSIICNILENKESEFENKKIIKHLPFRIELRKYLAYKKSNRGNILKYLNSLLEEEFGISNITEKNLDFILNQNENIIFFDGLDEIFKVEDKIEIKNDIENFHNSYPKTKSLTTSRIIGYDEAKFNNNEFQELEILNFQDNQIKEYIEKWYEKEEINPDIRKNEVTGFLEKTHEIDYELISNPLLLSLIVIIYRNTLALPESKLEIYQSCTKTLIDKWDDSKKELEINLDSSIYKRRENILADLAYWQYQQLSSDKLSITYEKVLYTVANTLEKLKIAEESDSYNTAEAFMEYALKRSIYFENNFTHKTFLEYYTAYWIYSNIEKKNKTNDRNQLIEKYIDNPFWHIVLELLFNMIDKNQADTEMMDELIVYQLEKDKNSLPFLLSTINSFKNTSIECLSTVINSSIDFMLDNYKSENFHSLNFDNESLHSRIFQIIKKMYENPTNKRIIDNKLIEIESNRIDLAELNYSLYLEIALINTNRENENNKFDFKLLNKESFDNLTNINKFLFISKYYFVLKEESSNSYFKTTLQFIKNFGLKELLTPTKGPFEENVLIDFFRFYLRNQLKIENISNTTDNLNILINLGLKKDLIIKYLINHNLQIAYDQKIYSELVNLFDKENDKELSIILLLLLFSHNTYLFNESDTLEKEIFNKSKKKEILLRIFKGNSRKKQILKLYDYALIYNNN